MKLSESGLGTIRIKNLDKACPAQDLLLQSGQLVQHVSGVYSYNNVPLKLNQRIEEVIKNVLEEYGCHEVMLPVLQPKTLWTESGRWNRFIDDGIMLQINTEKGDFAVAPTAEEAVTDFAKGILTSYKNLPVIYYQIGPKFRNEKRPRGYLLRGKAFSMMDAYSFDKDEEGLQKSYSKMRKAYIELFKRLGLDVIPVAADSGAMGDSKSEEFMTLSDIGEDTILIDPNTGKGLNVEILEREDYATYLKNEYGIDDVSKLEKRKAIELGHIFQLGTKYSSPLNATYQDKDNNSCDYQMACYGIGVSRTLATIYEKSLIRDKQGNPNGIALPINLAPYLLQIVPKMDNKEKVAKAGALYEILKKYGVETVLDDRVQGTIGSKMKDTRILGTPFMAVFGDKTKDSEIEVENIATGEKTIMTEEELVNKLIKINSIRLNGYSDELDIVRNNNVKKNDKIKQDENDMLR